MVMTTKRFMTTERSMTTKLFMTMVKWEGLFFVVVLSVADNLVNGRVVWLGAGGRGWAEQRFRCRTTVGRRAAGTLITHTVSWDVDFSFGETALVGTFDLSLPPVEAFTRHGGRTLNWHWSHIFTAVAVGVGDTVGTQAAVLVVLCRGRATAVLRARSVVGDAPPVGDAGLRGRTAYRGRALSALG